MKERDPADVLYLFVIPGILIGLVLLWLAFHSGPPS